MLYNLKKSARISLLTFACIISACSSNNVCETNELKNLNNDELKCIDCLKKEPEQKQKKHKQKNKKKAVKAEKKAEKKKNRKNKNLDKIEKKQNKDNIKNDEKNNVSELNWFNQFDYNFNKVFISFNSFDENVISKNNMIAMGGKSDEEELNNQISNDDIYKTSQAISDNVNYDNHNTTDSSDKKPLLNFNISANVDDGEGNTKSYGMKVSGDVQNKGDKKAIGINVVGGEDGEQKPLMNVKFSGGAADGKDIGDESKGAMEVEVGPIKMQVGVNVNTENEGQPAINLDWNLKADDENISSGKAKGEINLKNLDEDNKQ